MFPLFPIFFIYVNHELLPLTYLSFLLSVDFGFNAKHCWVRVLILKALISTTCTPRFVFFIYLLFSVFF